MNPVDSVGKISRGIARPRLGARGITDRWHALRTLQRRERRSLWFGLAPYATLALALLASSIVLRNNLAFADENGVIVMARPLYVPFVITTVFFSLYLALVSATTIARERDQGTLEVLFYGPVDAVAYTLGKYAVQMEACLAAAVVAFGVAWLYAQLTNLAFSPDLILVLILAVFATSAVVAFGILISTWARSTRAALAILFLIIAIFLGIQGGHQILSDLATQASAAGTRINPLLFLRNLLAMLNQALTWLSPLASLNQGIEALTVGHISVYLAMMGLGTLSTLAWLGLAIVVLERRGVRR